MVKQYLGVIPEDVLTGIGQFANRLLVDEELTKKMDIVHCLVEDDNTIGVIVYRIETFISGVSLPRFIHIILDTHIQKTKKALAFALRSQRMLSELGHKQMFCHTKHKKTEIIELAKKFGFKEWTEDGQGKYLYKTIGD